MSSAKLLKEAFKTKIKRSFKKISKSKDPNFEPCGTCAIILYYSVKFYSLFLLAKYLVLSILLAE